MALITCPECGRPKVSDTALSCPDCGFSIANYYEKLRIEEAVKETQRKNVEQAQKREAERLARIEKRKQGIQKNKKWLVIISLVIIFGVIVVGLHYGINGKKEYQNARKMYNDSNYSGAMGEFEKIIEYRDSEKYITKCKTHIAYDSYIAGDYINAYNGLMMTSDDMLIDAGIVLSDNVENLIIDCQHKCAENGHTEYLSGNYLMALSYYNICDSYDNVNYKIEHNACSSISRMLGTWKDYGNDITVKISETNVSIEGFSNRNIDVDGTYPVCMNGRQIVLAIGDDDNITISPALRDGFDYVDVKPGHRYVNFSCYSSLAEYNNDPTIPREPSEPQIGMTAAQVIESTWGKPREVNKTTFSWGTTEQWVYPNYKYIYLDNGIVTAISDKY